MNAVNATFVAVALAGGLVFFVGLVKLAVVPLALYGDAASRRRDERGDPTLLDEQPLVSIIVPAYNEERVLANCVRSILASQYQRIELIIVDDGSTDRTWQLAQDLAAQAQATQDLAEGCLTTNDMTTKDLAGQSAASPHLTADSPRVRAIYQANAGKGAALNTGIAESNGEVLFFVDADGLFAPWTVSEMLRGFHSPRIGAVCGDDRPVNLDRVQTRMLTILSHVGTGLVRRALVVLRSLLIVSGNIGAFPRHIVEEVGGFREDTVGEDLELTWRIQEAGYQVEFRPTGLVYAESPSTVRGLGRQRVRWARGLLQATRLHRRAVGNPRHGVFGLYLAFNTVNAIVVPVLQVLLLVALPGLLLLIVRTGPATDGESAAAAAETTFAAAAPLLGVALWLGLGTALITVLIALAMNGAWRDLRHLWTIVFWPAYSLFMATVMIRALWLEYRGAPAVWNKLTRSGVVSISGLVGGPDPELAMVRK